VIAGSIKKIRYFEDFEKIQNGGDRVDGAEVDFLEHILKKMGSTEIVVSSVRLSVRLLFLSR
jgi:hypothetical protein